MENAIWVDADACPVPVKEILLKAAQRTKVNITFVANTALRIPPLPSVKQIQTTKEFDAADNYIVESSKKGDLVITQDIPLASELIEKGVLVISPRGQVLDKENIKSRLNIRDFMETLRASGINTGGQNQFGQKEKQEFANKLDRWLTKYHKKPNS